MAKQQINGLWHSWNTWGRRNASTLTPGRRQAVGCLATLLILSLTLGDGTAPANADSPPPGIERREPWTTSRIVGSPEPPLPYITERVFPKLQFNHCLELTTAPGSDRLFVVEQFGKVFSFVDDEATAEADLVVDFAQDIPGVKHVYALAFHPDFATNRYCYVCYILAPGQEDGTHVSRFEMSDTNPPTIDVASETPLLTWLSGGHNGCCLTFGPDGYLYVSTGDGAPANPPDTRKTGQDISDLLSSILRIDVDHAAGEQNYRIPPDNPFVGRDGARGEVWAYGLRNPWRMSFDPHSGDLWVGDVGWELWEMMYRIERGGNYGWAVKEGRDFTHPEWPRGPTPILPPTIDHRHSESSSVTAGRTYRGARLGELQGLHIYGDYDTGKMWSFRYDQGQVLEHREIADTTHRIVSFGERYDGELLLLDHTAGTLHRLLPNPRHGESSPFPRRLSDSGLFSSLEELTPSAGVIGYSINAEQWADHATAERWVALPDLGSIQVQEKAWTFPENSVLAKTLSLEMHRGDPTTSRRVETQILHFNGSEWLPYTYRWNEQQSDAELVEAGGAEQSFRIVDPDAPGGIRQQTWRFAGRAECQRCHNNWSGPALAFDLPQLNRNHLYPAGSASQLETWAHIGLIESLPDTATATSLVAPDDTTASLNDRARSYLHTNCGHCHRMHAGGSVLSHMHFDLPLEKTNMVGARPSQGTFGIHAAEVVAPGDPFRSVLLYRMAKLGNGRMPYIGSSEVDRAGVALIHDWLEQLPLPTAAAAEPSSHAVVKLRAAESNALDRLQGKLSAAEQDEFVDALLASTSGAMQLLHAIEGHRLPPALVSRTIDRAARHKEVSVRELFERFLPADERVQRLGNVVHPDQILALQGDVARGREIFMETNGVSCKSCHRIAQQGTEIGPELTAIGKKLSPAQLLESILEPSKTIDPQYVTHLVETVDGRILSGLLLNTSPAEVQLKDAQGKVQRIAREDIEQLVPQRQSLMPELLLRDMTAQQVADLLAYLSSLK
ncbi:MAG: PQQ-dependent sugar dehydrogenase [Planctomycetales bacterium]|nr:PQQ-dependent sugar dehydrogenase [Planctomycetales bacterium]